MRWEELEYAVRSASMNNGDATVTDSEQSVTHAAHAREKETVSEAWIRFCARWLIAC